MHTHAPEHRVTSGVARYERMSGTRSRSASGHSTATAAELAAAVAAAAEAAVETAAAPAAGAAEKGTTE